MIFTESDQRGGENHTSHVFERAVCLGEARRHDFRELIDLGASAGEIGEGTPVLGYAVDDAVDGALGQAVEESRDVAGGRGRCASRKGCEKEDEDVDEGLHLGNAGRTTSTVWRERLALQWTQKREKERGVLLDKEKKIGELVTGSHGIHHTESLPTKGKGPPSRTKYIGSLTLASPILDSTRSSTHDARCYPQRKQGGANTVPSQAGDF